MSAHCKCWLAAFAFATLAAFAGQLSWILDIASNFRVQFAIGLGVIALALFIAADRRWALCALVLAGMNICTIVPLYMRPVTQNTASPVLRILYANVNYGNTHYDVLLRMIAQLKPDVVAISECSDGWAFAMEKSLLAQYPYNIIQLRPDAFGVAMFSRYPVANEQIEHWGFIPSIHGDIEFDGAPLTILTTHPLPPVSQDYACGRNRALNEIASNRSLMKTSLVLAADLNMTSWSCYFPLFCQAMNVVDSRIGFGVQPSWPIIDEHWRWCPLSVPLDHVLVSPDLVTLQRATCSPIGSDHLPVYVEIARKKGVQSLP